MNEGAKDDGDETKGEDITTVLSLPPPTSSSGLEGGNERASEREATSFYVYLISCVATKMLWWEGHEGNHTRARRSRS